MPDPHRRKLTGGHYKDIVAVVRGYAAKVLPPSDTAGTIAIGPVVWELSGRGRTNWYFVIGSADAAGTFRAGGFKIREDDKALADECRDLMITELVLRRPPPMIHTFDDELAMIRLCEAVFPCERTHSMRAAIEFERDF